MSVEHDLDYVVTFGCGCRVTIYYLSSYREADMHVGPIVPRHVPDEAHVRLMFERAKQALARENEEQARSN